MRVLWFALAVACSQPPDAPTSPTPPPDLRLPSPHEASEHAPLPEAPLLDPETVCGRAQRCCRAFAEATPNVSAPSACGEPAEVAEREDANARCERMIEGWRIALEHHDGVDPPATCQPGG